MRALFGSIASTFSSPKSLRETCKAKYKKFKGDDFSSIRERTKFLASFESKRFKMA